MTSEKVVVDLFLREKPAKILIGLKTGRGTVYATVLSREANCTYSHTIKILNFFRKLGIVEFEKRGRIKKVTLTGDGWEIAHNLESLMKRLLLLEDAASQPKQPSKRGRREK